MNRAGMKSSTKLLQLSFRTNSVTRDVSCLLLYNSEGGQQMYTLHLQTQNNLTPLLMFRPVIPLYVQETDVRSKRLDPDPA